ncbi:MAG: inorganic diphosphatase [Bacteroidota bacterium]
MIELAGNATIIDRPRGSAHPRYPEMIYPLDYGYLQNTSAGDGDGIDVWIGSKNDKTLTGILCTFDTLKGDAEIKLLIGCTSQDVETIQGFHGDMATLFIPNPMVEHDISN